MKDELAERLLTEILGGGSETLQGDVAELQALATVKYDAYGMFRPGVKFLESLAGWLMQFDEADRPTAFQFIREALVFVSFPEFDHLVQIAYPDLIRPDLIERVTRELSLPPYAVAAAVRNPLFRELERRTLILGLSDGARLDQLRRSASTLSTEQFHLTYTPETTVMSDRRDALDNALTAMGSTSNATFARIVLVDDFSGSGTSMLKPKGEGVWGGKLWKLSEWLHGDGREFFVEELDVLVVVYVATAQARGHLEKHMQEAGLGDWRLRVVMPLKESVPVEVGFPGIVPLCQKYHDPLVDDPVHTGSVELGFENCALPLVLHHNTPNNSISLLWGDTLGLENARPMRALFPRYARHHKDRP
jgi:hypothetical protein